MPPTHPPARRPGQLVSHRAHAPSRGRLWSALSVLLASVGCAPPGPQAPESATDALRHRVAVGLPLNTHISVLSAGDPAGARVVLVHGTPGSATAWADYLLDPPRRPGGGGAGPARLRPAAALTARWRRSTPRPPPWSPCCRTMAALWCCSATRSAGRSSPAWRPSTRTRVTALVLLAASLDPAQEEIHPMQWVGAWAPVRALLPRVLRNSNAELMAPEARARGPGACCCRASPPRC